MKLDDDKRCLTANHDWYVDTPMNIPEECLSSVSVAFNAGWDAKSKDLREVLEEKKEEYYLDKDISNVKFGIIEMFISELLALVSSTKHGDNELVSPTQSGYNEKEKIK